MVWYGMVWYGMVWYGMVWYGMVWYGMVWYGMVCIALNCGLTLTLLSIIKYSRSSILCTRNDCVVTND